ncbi:hypothetical protein [Streptomyces sp. NPDC059742]|uniref:hypothetical protein n=1 Tax=Streptomyces sp. NPDC059742 TaxID=3346927 RepID=UPI0036552E2A
MDSGAHPAHLREDHSQVDTFLLRPNEPAGPLRPVRALHQYGQDVVTEVTAQLAGRPARYRLLRVLAGLLLPAGGAFWGARRTASEIVITRR